MKTTKKPGTLQTATSVPAYAAAMYALFLAAMLTISVPAFCQVIEVEGGVGYAAVDMEAWSGTEPYDWGNLTSYYGVQVLFPINSTVSIGGGVAHQYLFWYDFRYPYGNSYITLTREVTATRVLALARFNFNRNFIDLGFGPYLFEDFTDFAVTAQFGRAFRLSEKLSLPVKFGTAIIADSDAMVIPFTAGLGLSYKFK